MAKYSDLRGTNQTLFQLGLGGLQFKNEGPDTALAARKSDDSGYAIMRGAPAVGSNDFVVLSQVSGGASVGTFAARPAAGTSGRIYIATDAPVGMSVDDGTQWRPMLSGMIPGIQPPAAATFSTSVNITSQTLADASGSLLYTDTVNGPASPLTFRGFAQNWPNGVTNTNSIEASSEMIAPEQAETGVLVITVASIFMRESSSGKLMTFDLAWYISGTGANTAMWLETIIGTWTSPTSRVGVTPYGTLFENGPVFVRLRRATANIVVEVSRDRQHWFAIQTTAVTTAFTTAPDQYGVGAWNIGSGSNNLINHLLAA